MGISGGEFRLYVDGAARGNPGPAGAGGVLMLNGQVVGRLSVFLGTRTNNEAEYEALIRGLALAVDQGVRGLEVCMDSELVVRQMQGNYKVKQARLAELHVQAQKLTAGFERVVFTHVPRTENKLADKQANLAIDDHEFLKKLKK